MKNIIFPDSSHEHGDTVSLRLPWRLPMFIKKKKKKKRRRRRKNKWISWEIEGTHGAFFFFFCVLQLDFWGSPFWVKFLRMPPIFNPTSVVVTSHSVFVDTCVTNTGEEMEGLGGGGGWRRGRRWWLAHWWGFCVCGRVTNMHADIVRLHVIVCTEEHHGKCR